MKSIKPTVFLAIHFRTWYLLLNDLNVMLTNAKQFQSNDPSLFSQLINTPSIFSLRQKPNFQSNVFFICWTISSSVQLRKRLMSISCIKLAKTLTLTIVWNIGNTHEQQTFKQISISSENRPIVVSNFNKSGAERIYRWQKKLCVWILCIFVNSEYGEIL